MRGRFCPEQGALIQASLQRAMEEEYQERKNVPAGTPADISGEIQDEIRAHPEPVASRRAAALLRMVQGYQSKTQGQNSSERKSEHWLVHIHTDMETLRQDGMGAESEIESGGRLCAETSRRIACDSSVIQWLDSHDGQPLITGRKIRTIPPAIRRALQRRDGGCRFPGCTATRFVDAHHIHHWADGGETSMSNLLLLCRHHHRLMHEGGFGLQKLSNSEFKFTNPAGISIPNCPAGRSRGNVNTLFALNDKRAIRITPKSSQSCWMGEKMDDQMAVEGLLFRE